MNLNKVFGLSCFLFCGALQANEPSFDSPLAKSSLLLDIITTDSGTLAVGERGHVLGLSNDTQQWQQFSFPVNTTLTGVYAISDNQWAVGHDASIFYSSDAGNSWQVQWQQPELDKPLLDVLFFDQQHGIAVGAYGLFYRTRDAGNSWQREIHTELLFEEDIEYLEELKQESLEDYQLELESILPHFNQLAFDGNTVYMVGEMGLVAKSNDFGSTWQKLWLDYDGSLFAVAQSDGQLLIGGLRGAMFIGDANGRDFKRLAVKSKASINAIVSHQGKHHFLANNGMVLSVEDGVVTEHQIPEEKSILNGVIENNELMLATEVGILTHSIPK